MTGLRYHLLALAVVAIWGVTFVCTKVLIGAGMDPAAGGRWWGEPYEGGIRTSKKP